MPTTSNTPDQLLAALAARPGSTAAELAELTGLGRSTVGKLLVTLESECRATRTAGGRDGARRLPDRWSAAARRSHAKRRGTPGRQGATVNCSRLGKGELRAMVLAHLQARPGEAFTPTAVAAALGRSAGAVSNAMVTLVNGGAVAQVSAAPRRFAYLA